MTGLCLCSGGSGLSEFVRMESGCRIGRKTRIRGSRSADRGRPWERRRPVGMMVKREIKANEQDDPSPVDRPFALHQPSRRGRQRSPGGEIRGPNRQRVVREEATHLDTWRPLCRFGLIDK